MDIFFISVTALLGSALSFYSGFGLGTLLVPVFALFFPLDIAIAMTAIVHFLNNVFKLILVGKAADRDLVLRFGLPSFLASLAGAYVLSVLGKNSAIVSFHLLGNVFTTTALKMIISTIIFLFALLELSSVLSKLQFKNKHFFVGGLLSGFFGGLSGNQGALRTLFLVKAELSKEGFIATGVVIACIVDIARLSIYGGTFFTNKLQLPYAQITVACLAAFAGAYMGNKLVKKVTLKSIQIFVAIALLLFSACLFLGVL